MNILPEGEQLRRAIKWISDERLEKPGVDLFRLIEAACLRFDLTPKDEEFLIRQITEKKSETAG